MDYVCNRCLFSIPSKVEMAEEQEYLRYFEEMIWSYPDLNCFFFFFFNLTFFSKRQLCIFLRTAIATNHVVSHYE